MAKLRPSSYMKAREALLSGNAALRIQAMADLEKAVRADQRRLDAEAVRSCGHVACSREAQEHLAGHIDRPGRNEER